jgi:transcriptional regulator GlxA family with amidase domain
MSRRPARPIHVEFLVGEGMLDGPPAAMADALQLINQIAALRGARRSPTAWQWTTPEGRAMRRSPRGHSRVRLPDMVVVAGWQARNGPHLNTLVRRARAACARLRAVHEAGGQVLAFYTGVALLGEAGLLDGRPAVVPWPFIASTLRHAPNLQLMEGEAWTVQDRIWTADSPTLATEIGLHALAACGLADLAEAGRSVLLHTPERQRLVKAIAQDSSTRVGPGTLERARRWIEDHLHEPYSLSTVAQAAATSERSLLRHFRAAFQCTPLQMMHRLRVTRARVLLETTYLPVEGIAERCGWRDAVMLRTVFQRETGLTPAAYRERFRLRTERRRWGQDLAEPSRRP